MERVHVMSELIPEFKTYREFCGEKEFIPCTPNPNQQLISKDGERILPERGLGQILAVAFLINDVDVIGGSGANIGFKVMKDAKGNEYAQTIKIDPGYAFDQKKGDLSNRKRTIRVASAGSLSDIFVHFDQLPSGTKEEFLVTVEKILHTSRPIFKGLFTREGAHNFLTEFKMTADQLADFLVERQAKLKSEYSEDLDQLIKENSQLFRTDQVK